MLKILHFVNRFAVGGLENGLVNIINGLDESKYFHIIVCLNGFDDFHKRIIGNNYILIKINTKPGFSLKYYHEIYKIFKKNNPDIVHTRNLFSVDLQMIAYLAGIKKRVHSEHGRCNTDISGTKKYNIIVRRLSSYFINQFITVSGEIKNYLSSNVKINPEKIVCIRNGVNLSKFNNATPINTKISSLLMVGRVEPVKNPMLVIKVFHQLVENFPSLQLIVVGDGSLLLDLKSYAKKNKLEKNILFAGEVNNVSDFMTEGHIFVQASFIEGISNTLLEAMASGLPCVVTNVGGNPELITDKSNGTLVHNDDYDSLLSALEYYIKNPKIAYTHGQNARQSVVEQFSLDTMINRYEKLYLSQ